MNELPKQYDPKQVEPEVAQLWEAGNFFHAEPDDRPPEQRFCIVIPPPNVTGALHLGHALNNTVQDVLVRWHRMMGHNTLWIPGTDHAGIATQAVVEKRLKEEENLNRHDIGREALVNRIWQWKDEYEARIISQLKLMGCSCDFDRKRFTLDDGCSRAVRETFFKLFRDGYIVRGKRLVNWDCELQTAVADDEVYHEKVKGKFYHFRYPLKDVAAGVSAGRNEQVGLVPPYVVIATTRPETMLGDTAVAVNPNDERYKHLVGKTIILPLMNREIPIIADEWADPKVGSGCVKITPAHDPNDYEVWQRHPEIGCINILNPNGTINENGDSADGKHKYAGLDRFDARKAILKDLEELDLIEKIEKHEHEVGHSDRSKSLIEPYLSDQWFLRMGDFDIASDKEPQASACAMPQKEPQASACATLQTEQDADDAYAQALACATVEWDSDAWLLTWTTYGTWLPGDDRGFVSRRPDDGGSQTINNVPETPYDTDMPKVRDGAAHKMSGEALRLTTEQAQVAFKCIVDVCDRHRINPLAIAVMANHVHVLCQAEQDGSSLLQLFKGKASKVLSERWKLTSAPRWWTKSGSKRHLKSGADFTVVIEYVRAQANALAVWTVGKKIQGAASFSLRDAEEGTERRNMREIAQAKACGSLGGGESHRHAEIAQAEARGSLTTRGLASMALEAVENGSVRFIPERYKNAYLDWLGEKRDWCISRQLWWGHRIPVWKATFSQGAIGVLSSGTAIREKQRKLLSELQECLQELAKVSNCEGEFVVTAQKESSPSVCFVSALTEQASKQLDDVRSGMGRARAVALFEKDPIRVEAISSVDPRYDVCRRMRRLLNELVQDEDVLDTWFSSALWPHSTLGWPECVDQDRASARAEARGSLLDYYYPTSVLITSRDIITLWIVRMVLTGLYNVGQKPFHEVYIHPKILDGRGVTMSKSKGNGVDPLDIIEVFGADALRFGIAAMTTETQDIRMPVEYRCPHCEKTTPQTQKNMFGPDGNPSKVLACSSCQKEFATRWADAAIQQEKGLALMVSDKFEAARNFTNKLWNAARFAFMNLAPQAGENKEPQASACAIAEPPVPLDLKFLPTEDRWILAELSEVIRATHEALSRYQFSRATIGLREFFWNSLCDWYLEMVKYRIAEDHSAAAARQILAFCLDQVLRLLHPVVPFITERLWRSLNEITPVRGLPDIDGIGIVYPGSSAQPVKSGSKAASAESLADALTIAKFPPPEGYAALADQVALDTFHDLQAATRAIREVRNSTGIEPKASVAVTIKTKQSQAAGFQAEAHILKRMARIEHLTIDPAAQRPARSAIKIVGDLQIFVHDVIEDEPERCRVEKELSQLEKRIKTTQSKLANEGYVRSAPPEVVQQTRDILDTQRAEHDTFVEILKLLG